MSFKASPPKVVLVQRSGEAAEIYASWLESSCFHVTRCPGPGAPFYNCYMLGTSRCPIAAEADLLIYDPWCECDTDEPDATELIRALHARYGATPILVLAADRGFPVGLIDLSRQEPAVRLLFRPDRDTLLRTVSEMAAGRLVPFCVDTADDESTP